MLGKLFGKSEQQAAPKAAPIREQIETLFGQPQQAAPQQGQAAYDRYKADQAAAAQQATNRMVAAYFEKYGQPQQAAPQAAPQQGQGESTMLTPEQITQIAVQAATAAVQAALGQQTEKQQAINALVSYGYSVQDAEQMIGAQLAKEGQQAAAQQAAPQGAADFVKKQAAPKQQPQQAAPQQDLSVYPEAWQGNVLAYGKNWKNAPPEWKNAPGDDTLVSNARNYAQEVYRAKHDTSRGKLDEYQVAEKTYNIRAMVADFLAAGSPTTKAARKAAAQQAAGKQPQQAAPAPEKQAAPAAPKQESEQPQQAAPSVVSGLAALFGKGKQQAAPQPQQAAAPAPKQERMADYPVHEHVYWVFVPEKNPQHANYSGKFDVTLNGHTVQVSVSEFPYDLGSVRTFSRKARAALTRYLAAALLDLTPAQRTEFSSALALAIRAKNEKFSPSQALSGHRLHDDTLAAWAAQPIGAAPPKA